jgi:acyl-CoA thioester hydrolase
MRLVRHRYDCPLRWADLDLLGHVNNVKYVDYLQEARGFLLRACLAAAGIDRHEGDPYVVVRHEVSFRAPLMFGSRPVAIESWVSAVRSASFTLDHEVFHEDADGARTVYLRARTVLAPFQPAAGRPRRLTDQERDALAPYAEVDEGVVPSGPVRVEVPRERATHHPVHVRFSDIDIYRHVNNVKYVEYFQEARIGLMRKLKGALTDYPRLSVVVAQTDLEYVAPMVLRSDPYDCWSTVSRIGTKSMTIEAEITAGTGGADDAPVLARSRAALVMFDPATQRSVTPPPGYLDAVMNALGAPTA